MENSMRAEIVVLFTKLVADPHSEWVNEWISEILNDEKDVPLKPSTNVVLYCLTKNLGEGRSGPLRTHTPPVTDHNFEIMAHQHGTSHMPTWWGSAVVSCPFGSVKKSNEHMPFVFCLWVSSPVYPRLCSFLIFYSSLEFLVLLGGSSHMLSIITKIFSLEKLERSLRKYVGGGGEETKSLRSFGIPIKPPQDGVLISPCIALTLHELHPTPQTFRRPNSDVAWLSKGAPGWAGGIWAFSMAWVRPGRQILLKGVINWGLWTSPAERH